MPELVEPVIEDARWEAAGIPAVAERAARATLLTAGRDPDVHEVGLLLCDDARMAALNGRFRDTAGATNVLSFPAFVGELPAPCGDAGEGPTFIGDVALGFEACAAEAAAAGIALQDHAAHLVAHGVLHLLGHDHGDDAAAEAMEALETNVLASMGVANPYSR